MKYRKARWGTKIEFENGEYLLLAWKAWLLAGAGGILIAQVLKYIGVI